jgi:hypothetical protein
MDVVVWRGETERELVVLSGDRRYVMLVDDDVEMMRSGFRYFVDQNGVRSVCVVGFGIGDDVYDMMVIVMCLGMGLRLCVDSSGESIWRLVYWGESDFYRRVLLEYGSRCVSRCTLRRVIGDVRVRERFGVLDGESGLYMFECPQCMCVFTIHESELACKIARHGVGLDGVPVNPHASFDECMRLLEDGRMLGCGCPVRFVCDSVDSKKYRVEKGLFSD